MSVSDSLPWRTIFAVLLAGLVALGILFLDQFLPFGIWIDAAIAIPIAAVVFFGLLIVFRVEELTMLLEWIRRCSRDAGAMNLIPVVKGALTFVPGVMALRGQGTTGGSDSADYCYGVWLKHVSLLADAGLRGVPPVIAELGPGDSLGTGLCALLSGAERYVALDVVQFANTARNLLVFDRLVQLFRERAPRPTRGWPDFDSLLDARHFPSAVLDEARLSRSLAPDRVAAIRDAVESAGKPDGNGMIEYRVPWSDPSVVRTASVDLIISHSVMEHVGDVEGTYAACASWLRPGGWMSHQVDFSDHGITGQWNGQLAYPDLAWASSPAGALSC